MRVEVKSVIASGNSTFQWNLDRETAKLHKNHFLDFWFTRKTKNTMPFLPISLAFRKPEISAIFLLISGVFLGFLSNIA